LCDVGFDMNMNLGNIHPIPKGTSLVIALVEERMAGRPVAVQAFKVELQVRAVCNSAELVWDCKIDRSAVMS
jgi:hypothetical protein